MRSRNASLFKAKYVIALGVLILGIGYIGFFVVKDPALKVIFSDILSPLANLAGAIFLFIAAKETMPSSKSHGLGWLFFAIAQLLNTIGDILWAILELGLHQTPFPSAADICYASFYPVFLIGAFCFQFHRQSHYVWFTKFIDFSIVLIASLLGYWSFLLSPILASVSNQPMLSKVLSLSYPVGDLLLILAILWMIDGNDSAQMKDSPGYLILAMLIIVVADTLFSYETLTNTYHAGNWDDFTYLIASVLIIGSAFSQIRASRNISHSRFSKVLFQKHPVTFYGPMTYLPSLWIIVAYLLLLLSKETSDFNDYPILYLGVGVIIILTVIRLFVSLQDNRLLFSKLQTTLDHLQEQATVLENTNHDLSHEVNNREKIESQLIYDNTHDPLTDLPNRTLFNDYLFILLEKSKFSQKQVYSLLYIDLDQFKVINDSMGHEVGDQLLVTIANRLQNLLSRNDFFARLGGDEFAIIHSNLTQKESVAALGGQILETIKQLFNLDNHKIFTTASIGILPDIARYTKPGEVLRDADIAMYHAKREGKDRFSIFQDWMRQEAYTRLEIEEDLRKVLELNELEIYYQPIVDLEKNKLLGLESLLRWNHPKYGQFMPIDFIRIMEETELILPIGKWVMETACAQVAEWHKKYPTHSGLAINVNVSGKQLLHRGFVDEVKHALEKTGLEAKYLKLEITENILNNNFDTLSELFYSLNQLGVELEIDDFGTGYSSLSSIQHLPFQYLKIDKSFVDGIGIKENAIDLIQAIVLMANKMNMKTIAEGIESRKQLNQLIQLGCNFGQGYIFSRPLNKDLAEKLLSDEITLASAS